jgi:hypothetical protein
VNERDELRRRWIEAHGLEAFELDELDEGPPMPIETLRRLVKDAEADE